MGGEALARRTALGERQGFLALALEALAHERVQCRQPVQQRRGILGVQRVPCNTGIDEGPQLVRLAAELVVLLGGFDDGGEVDAAEALQLLDLLGDLVELGEHLLQQLLALLLAGLRLLLRGVVVLDGVGEEALAALAAVFLALLALLVVCLQADGQWLELLLAGGCAVAQLLGDVEDEVVHLLKLHISELVHKGALIFGGPAVVVLIVLEQLLQLVVVDVLGLPRRVHALAEGAAELHGRDGGLLQATNCVDSDSARAARNVGSTAIASAEDCKDVQHRNLRRREAVSQWGAREVVLANRTCTCRRDEKCVTAGRCNGQGAAFLPRSDDQRCEPKSLINCTKSLHCLHRLRIPYNEYLQLSNVVVNRCTSFLAGS